MKDLIMITLLLAILLATTNPPVEVHQRAVSDAVRDIVSDSVSEPTMPMGQRILGTLTGEAAAGLTQLFDEALFQYRNYVLFSTLTDVDENLVSIGMLGQVVTRAQAQCP